MDINYLQDILSKLALLDHTQHRENEQLKIHAVEAFKKLFPEDKALIRSIENLRFDMFQNMPNQYCRDLVLDSKNKLQSVIEAKIEILKHLPISKSLHDLEQSNQYQASIVKQHERIIEQYRTELKKADERLAEAGTIQAEQETKIRTLEIQAKRNGLMTKLTNSASIGIILTLIGGLFTTGYYVGNTKFDRDKIQLSDENRTIRDSIGIYKKGIEYMRNNSDSALNAMASMPYSHMKLDTSEYRKVQSTIEKGGYMLYLNKNYLIK